MVSLARLAADSGGRYTENTNDLTLGYARAQRDLGCVYTVGFYDEPVAGEPRSVVVRVKRPGLRAIHPAAYLFRTGEERRAALTQAAFHAPSMFDRGIVRAHLFPLQPTSRREWDGLLALSFPVPFGKAGARQETRDFGAVVFRGSDVVHRFDRRITLVPKDETVRSAPLVTFVERVTLAPGAYRLAVVVTDPASPLPESTEVGLILPELPRGSLIVLEPLLGTRGGADLLVIAHDELGTPEHDRVGEAASFRPLLVQQIEEPTEIVALNRVCRIGNATAAQRHATVGRAFRAAGGAAIASTEAVQLALDPEATVACQHLVDVVPPAVLPPGEYVFEVWLTDAPPRAIPRAESRFAVAHRPASGSGHDEDKD